MVAAMLILRWPSTHDHSGACERLRERRAFRLESGRLSPQEHYSHVLAATLGRSATIAVFQHWSFDPFIVVIAVVVARARPRVAPTR